MELLGAFLTGVVGPLLYLLINKHIEKKKQKGRDKVVDAITDTNLINEELEEILEEFDGDRIWISQFHNGGNFYPTGKSIQKFSIFYEVAKPGISIVSHIFNNIPCSLYPKAFDHMLKEKGIFIPDYDDPEVATLGLKGAAASGGNKSSYNLPLFTFDDKYMGVIGIDYVVKKHRMTKAEWEHFQIRASKISGYLSSYLSN